MDLKKLEIEQFRLQKKIVLENRLSEIKTIAGCDITYTGNNMVCCFLVMDYPSLKVREFKVTTDIARFPHIPGFLSYREAPIVIETYHKLELDPDMILIDGNGILHPRGIGLASHIGLSLDKPTIGVAKSLLCGEPKEDAVEMAGVKKALIIQTREVSKPIYISPGHMIDFDKALEIVRTCHTKHKLPEPLHQAHKIANKEKRRLK